MTAPVSDDAIAAVRSIAATPVTHDGVIRNAGSDRDLVNRDNEAVVWGQRIDTVGKAFQLKGRGIGGQVRASDPADLEQTTRRSH